MKNKAALVVPALMLLFGIYALLTALNSGGDQVSLISNHAIPRNLAMMMGVIGLAGGGLVMMTMISGKKSAV